MKASYFKLILVFVLFLNQLSNAQEIDTVKLKKKETMVSSIGETGMYNGSKSPEANSYFEQAIEYSNKKDFTNAKKMYLKAINADPGFVEAYDNLGLVYRKLGDFGKAAEYYKKSIEIYPKGVMAHVNLAMVYTIQNKPDLAISEYKKIISLEPYNPEGYYGLANIYINSQDFDNALVNAKLALDLYESDKSPYTRDAYYMVGLAYFYKGDKRMAKENVFKAKEMGVNVPAQLISELSTESPVKKEYKLENAGDYKKYEKDVLEAIDWVTSTSLSKDVAKRKDLNAFIVKWINGCPYISVELSDKIITYSDCQDCLLMFLCGWTKYAIETENGSDKIKCNLAATETVIKFYEANKVVMGTNKNIEKLIVLQKNNELEKFIKSKL